MKYTKRQLWNQDFEKQSVALGIYKPGQVRWDDAHYFYLTGRSVNEAIEILKRHKESEVEK